MVFFLFPNTHESISITTVKLENIVFVSLPVRLTDLFAKITEGFSQMFSFQF